MTNTFEEVYVNAILALLASEDHKQFGNVDNIWPDEPEDCMISLIRSIVHHTLVSADSLDRNREKQAVAQTLESVAGQLRRAAFGFSTQSLPKTPTTGTYIPQSGARDAEAVMKELLPPLQKIALEIRELFDKTRGDSLVARYDIGTLIAFALDGKAECGPNPVGQLAAFLGVPDTEIYSYRRIATIYTREEVTGLEAAQMANGDRLRWEHLNSLSEIKYSSDRRKFEDLTLTNSWSPRKLRKELVCRPAGEIMDLRIDPYYHDVKAFRLHLGRPVHLIDDEGQNLVVTITDLVVDESPSIFGGSCDLGQIGETSDGRFVLCVDSRDGRRPFVIEVFATLADLANELWNWDPYGSYSPADALFLLYALEAIKLKSELKKPTCPR